MTVAAANRPHAIRTRSDMASAVAALSRNDDRFRHAVAVADLPPLRRRPPGFASLARIIVGQQLSIHAADAIWRRAEAALGEVTPETVARTREAVLREAGLGRMKTGFIRDLAVAANEGALNFRRIARLGDESALAELQAFRGVGRWTAEVYMLFCHGRPDIWPAGDLALQVAAARLFGLDDRPGVDAMDAMAEAWRPWRGVAARVLWNYYRAADAAKPATPV